MAVELATTPLVASFTVVSRAVISVELVLIVPSAVVTRVSNADNPDAVAATPVVALFTVDSKAVMSVALVVIAPSVSRYSCIKPRYSRCVRCNASSPIVNGCL
jgi:hypothetical protein